MNRDEVGRQAHDDALDFLAEHFGSGKPSEAVYLGALADESTGSVRDPDLERHLDVGDALDGIVRCDGPIQGEDDYLDRLLAEARRLGVDEGF